MTDFYPTVQTSRGSSSFTQRGGTRNRYWRPSKALAKQVMGIGLEQIGQPIEYYPGSTVVPTDPWLSQGMQSLYNRAAAGSPISGAAEQLGAATLRGDYLAGANPYLDDYYSRMARGVTSNYMTAVRPDLESRFAGAGRTGGGSYGAALGRSQEALGTSLGDLASEVYMNTYEAERGRQQQTLAMAPMLQQLGYADINEMMRAGAARQSEGQRILDADVARWQYEQLEPWKRAGLGAGLYTQSPVVAGTDYWQSGTSRQEGKDVMNAPYLPQSGGQQDPMAYWMGMLSNFI